MILFKYPPTFGGLDKMAILTTLFYQETLRGFFVL
jgi:hypothetical protein